MFGTSLVLSLNNFQNLKQEHYNFLEEQKSKINQKYLTNKKLQKYLFENDLKSYTKLQNLYKSLNFTKENILWSISYYQLFQKDNQLNYLDTSVKLLQSCKSHFMRFVSKSNYTIQSIPYTSNNRFCSFSQNKKSQEIRFQVVETLKYYSKKGLTHSFLTISPKNIKNITKEDYENLCKVLKEFWRNPVISNVYSGYFGVEEVVEKKGEYNVHFHFLCLRDKSMKGFLHYKVISEVWENVCNKYGNEKIKGSKISDIRAPKIYDDDKQLGAAKYILQYLAKGSKFKSQDMRIEYIKATEGMRKIRAGGLLAQRFQRNIATKQNIQIVLKEFEYSINNYDSYVKVQLTYETYTNWKTKETKLVKFDKNADELKPKSKLNFGGKYIKSNNRIIEISKPIEIDSNIFALNLLFGDTIEQISNKIGFLTFNEIKTSLFSKKKLDDPFFFKSEFNFHGIKRNKFISDISSPYFHYFALEPYLDQIKKVPGYIQELHQFNQMIDEFEKSVA